MQHATRLCLTLLLSLACTAAQATGAKRDIGRLSGTELIRDPAVLRPQTGVLIDPDLLHGRIPLETSAPIDGSQPFVDGVDLSRGLYGPTIELDVLPARRGLVPQLKLAYSALGRDGHLGNGWRWAFLSSIERRNPLGGTPDLRNVADDPSEAFLFQLDGTELVPNPNEDGTYRPVNDSFTVIRPITRFGLVFLRVVAWEVVRDGITRVYGADEGPSFCQNGVEYATEGCESPVRWYLTKIRDSLGNKVSIEYESPQWRPGGINQLNPVLAARTTLESSFVGLTDTRKLRPAKIVYNRDAHEIVFEYETRPDVRSEWRDGIQRTTAHRLQRVLVRAIRDGETHLSHSYRLAYVRSKSDGRSMLDAVYWEGVSPATGEVSGEVLVRRMEYADEALSGLSWDAWEEIPTTGKSLIPDEYEYSDEQGTRGYETVSQILNVDNDPAPDLLILNTNCEIEPPDEPPSRTEDNSDDPRLDELGVVAPPKSLLIGCDSDHRVFLNTPTADGGRELVYNRDKSDQLNELLGPLRLTSKPARFQIVDVDGDAWPDLLLGTVQTGPNDESLNGTLIRGSLYGWVSQPIELPWTDRLGGHDPFKDLQLADLDGDSLPDLVGTESFFRNSGVAPYFDGNAPIPIRVVGPNGQDKSLPANQPPAEPDAGCMARNASPRFVENELGVYDGSSSDLYLGTDDDANRVSPQQWVWRHTSFGDVNGDGLADRTVALAWPEEGAVGRDFAVEYTWRDAGGSCGGVNRVYLGDGLGGFHDQGDSIGGSYDWPGGPRAQSKSHMEVQTAPALTFVYRPPVNHHALVDVDGDARAELLQRCSGRLHALPDRGLNEESFGVERDSEVCAHDGLQIPDFYTGGSGALPAYVGQRDDRITGGFYDLDADGLMDLAVAPNTVHPNDTTLAGGETLRWRRNLRSVPQGRLTALIGPYGGRTELSWTTNGVDQTGGKTVLPALASIEGANGRTEFRFRSPYYSDTRFLGYTYAEAWGTAGVVEASRFTYDYRRRGVREEQATYWPDGSLHRLLVYMDAWTARGEARDSSAPYFNPVVRTCSFEFDADATADNPDPFVDVCREFDGTEDPPGRLVPHQAPAGAQVSAATARIATIPQVTPLPQAKDYRLRITEFAWDSARGVLTQETAYGSTGTAKDNTSSHFTYHPWSEELATHRLYTRRTESEDGGARRDFEYPLEDYQGTQWGREIQHRRLWLKEQALTVSGLSPVLGQQRSRTRDFSDGVLASETAWGEQRRVDYSVDHCGLVSRRETALGWESLVHDPVCRLSERRTHLGLVERTEYDDFNRPLETVLELPDGLQRITRYAYDRHASLDRPAEVESVLLPNGRERLVKRYVDGHGREWQAVQCLRATGAGDDWTNSLDEAYPCGTETITKLTLYSALSGLESYHSLAFGEQEGPAILSSEPTYSDLLPGVSLGGVSGTRRYFDRMGRLRSTILPDGRTVRQSYDVGTEITETDDVVTEVRSNTTWVSTYRNGVLLNKEQKNAFGELLVETDALGNETTHGYDSWGRRTTTELPEVDVWESCEGPPIRYRPRRTSSYSVNDEPISSTDPLGRRTQRAYDEHGRLVEITGPDGATLERRRYFDSPPDRRRIETDDDLGNTRTVWLDSLDRPTRQQEADGTVTRIQYDALGREVLRRLPSGELIETEHDWHDRPVSVTRIMGSVEATETREYDARGNLLRSVDADGEVRQRSYDQAGRLLTEFLGDSGGSGRQKIVVENQYADGRLSERVHLGVRSALRYDEHGRLARILTAYDPDDPVQALLRENRGYNARDEVEALSDKRGQGTRTDYDEHGRTVAIHTTFQDAILATTRSGYDAAGNELRSEDERGLVTCFEYDELDRPVRISAPGRGPVEIEYLRNPPHPVTAAPTASTLTRTRQPTGEVSEIYHDGNRRLWLRKNAQGVVDEKRFEKGLVTGTLRYDRNGTLTAVKPMEYHDGSARLAADWDWLSPEAEADCLAGGADCLSAPTRFTYTPGGRLETTTDAAGNISRHHYALDGTLLLTRIEIGGLTDIREEYDADYPIRIARETGPAGDEIRSEYSLERYLRTSRIVRSGPGGANPEITELEYDGSGNRSRARFTSPGGREVDVTWTHDRFGRKATKTYTVDGTRFSAPTEDFSFRWDYEPTGQLRSLHYPSGNQATYLYDSNGFLRRVVAGPVPGAPLIATYQDPDGSGRFLTTELAGGVVIRRSYQRGAEATRILRVGRRAFQEIYRYDALGRLSNVERRNRRGPLRTQAYSYEVRNLLTADLASTSPGTLQGRRYGYDRAGRRESVQALGVDTPGTTASYAYHGGNRLARAGVGAIPEAHWDGQGRPRQDHRGNRFFWGHQNQLSRIEAATGEVLEMLHDADGQRVARRRADEVDYFLSGDTSGGVLTHLSADGGSADIVRAPDGGVLAILDAEGRVSPWVASRSDRQLLLAGPRGQRQTQRNSAFGEVEASTELEIGFHQTWASGVGPLRIAGVRVYDPEVGRFLTPDPLGMSAAPDPGDSADLYRYAHNNPIARTDSSGYLGIAPPQTTTIVVDGMVMEVLNGDSWKIGTHQVANQAAFIAGVRAGLSRGMKVRDAVAYSLAHQDSSVGARGRPGKEESSTRVSHGGFSLRLRLPRWWPFGGGRRSQTAQEGSAQHSDAVEEASAQANGGGPANGLVFDSNGKIVRAASGVDPTSRAYWVRTKNPEGEAEIVGADSQEVLDEFFKENQGYERVGQTFSGNDVEAVTVVAADDPANWETWRSYGTEYARDGRGNTYYRSWRTNQFELCASGGARCAGELATQQVERDLWGVVGAQAGMLAVGGAPLIVGELLPAVAPHVAGEVVDSTIEYYSGIPVIVSPKDLLESGGKFLARSLRSAEIQYNIFNMNPGLIKDAVMTGGKGARCMNCADTSIALDLFLRSDVRVMAKPGAVTPNKALEVLYGAKFSPPMSLDDAISYMRAQGPEFQGIIAASSPGQKVGHFFNALNNNGAVQFWDAQAGFLLPRFAARLEWSRFRVLRTDTQLPVVP